jgi:hypothetical protein
MANKPELLTAAQLDAMTPNERMAAFEQRVVNDLDELPEEFRNRVVATAERLGQERRTSTEA